MKCTVKIAEVNRTFVLYFMACIVRLACIVLHAKPMLGLGLGSCFALVAARAAASSDGNDDLG
jgi:hypothetical protein